MLPRAPSLLPSSSPHCGWSVWCGSALLVAALCLGVVQRIEPVAADCGSGESSVLPGSLLQVFPNSSSSYSFHGVDSVATDRSGNIYVADGDPLKTYGTSRVVVLSPSGELMHAFPNTSSGSSGYSFSVVYGLAVDGSGKIYAADYSTSGNGGYGRVMVLSSAGALLSAFPNTSSPSSSSYSFHGVNGVAVDRYGNIYVADGEALDNGGTGRVVVLSSTGDLRCAFPNTSSASTSGYSFSVVYDVAVDDSGNIYVADGNTGDNGGSGRVVVLSSAGALLYAFPDTSSASTSSYTFSYVNGVAVDGSGNIYVADSSTVDNSDTGRVVVLSSVGELLYVFPNTSSPTSSSYSFAVVSGVAVDRAGSIYVADYAVDNGSFGRVVVLAGLPQQAVCSSSSSSSPTGLPAPVVDTPAAAPSVRGDPQFVGLLGQSFQVHGLDGAVYNLISDAALQLNARFAFLDGPRPCPVMPITAQPTTCWSHAGSYLSQLGLLVKDSGDEVLIGAGSAAAGFAFVGNAGVELAVGQSAASGSVSLLSSHELRLQAGSFIIEVENADGFVNLRSVQLIAPLSRLRSHGLLGQTWNERRYDSSLRIIEGEVDDYLLSENHVFGTQFPFNQYERTAKAEL